MRNGSVEAIDVEEVMAPEKHPAYEDEEVLNNGKSIEEYAVLLTKASVKGKKAISFPKPQVPLEDLKNSGLKKNKRDFPKVFCRDPKTGVCNFSVMKFGMDVFKRAGVKKSSKVVLEEIKTGSVIVRAESTELTHEQKEKEYEMFSEKIKKADSKKSLALIEAEDLDNFKLECSEYVVAAGAFTMRTDAIGFVSRFLVNVTPYINLKKSQPVRVAAVVLPVLRFLESDRRYLLITQRQNKKKGTYNDLWVFPGGHVDPNETLKQAAVREVSEETGLDLTEKSIIPLCCWQEFYIPKQIQYLMMVFYGELEVEEEVSEVEFISTVGIQLKEVKSCALMPEETWQALAHRESPSQKSHKYKKVLGVHSCEDHIETTEFNVRSIAGSRSLSSVGIGAPHRFAVRKLLESLNLVEGKLED